MAGQKGNAGDAPGPAPQMVWIWVVFWVWFGFGFVFFFVTLASCRGDQARRHEEPESVSERTSVVITLLLPELS